MNSKQSSVNGSTLHGKRVYSFCAVVLLIAFMALPKDSHSIPLPKTSDLFFTLGAGLRVSTTPGPEYNLTDFQVSLIGELGTDRTKATLGMQAEIGLKFTQNYRISINYLHQRHLGMMRDFAMEPLSYEILAVDPQLSISTLTFTPIMRIYRTIEAGAGISLVSPSVAFTRVGSTVISSPTTNIKMNYQLGVTLRASFAEQIYEKIGVRLDAKYYWMRTIDANRYNYPFLSNLAAVGGPVRTNELNINRTSVGLVLTYNY